MEEDEAVGDGEVGDGGADVLPAAGVTDEEEEVEAEHVGEGDDEEERGREVELGRGDDDVVGARDEDEGQEELDDKQRAHHPRVEDGHEAEGRRHLEAADARDVACPEERHVAQVELHTHTHTICHYYISPHTHTAAGSVRKRGRCGRRRR